MADGAAGSPDSLARRERAFAALSVEKGMKEAFLSYLAEDAFLFRPGPVDGRKAVREQSTDSTFTLDWRPLLVCVSQDGSLGYTTGPWILTDRGGPEVRTRTGHFVSIWRHEQESGWKVILDLGISHPDEGVELSYLPEPLLERCSGAPGGWHKNGYTSLLEREREFSATAETGDFKKALLSCAAQDIRLFRPGRSPLAGPHSAAEGMSVLLPGVRWEPGSGSVSGSADLGFTYGEYISRNFAGESGSYVHIWRRDRTPEWRVVLMIHSPRQRSGQ